MKLQSQANDINKIGDEVKEKLEEIQGDVQKGVRAAFRYVMTSAIKELDTMEDTSIANRLSNSLSATARSYISVIQSIEMVVQDFEKQLFQKKMSIYKNNNEGRAKMDGIAAYPYFMYYAQNLFAAPVRV